jgi:acetyltransferase
MMRARQNGDDLSSQRISHIKQLLDPSSIAVVGASNDAEKIGGRPLQILSQRGYKGRLYPVNPKYETIQGRPAYADISDLPSDVEMYIFCVPAQATVELVEKAAAHGAKAGVILSGGFAEVGPEGVRLQERLRRIANEHDLALLGPNSLGLASFTNRVCATFATTLSTMPSIEPGDVALLSQSGGTAFNLFTESYWAGARFSHVIASGNEAGLAFADYLSFLATDDATQSVVGYLEGVSDGGELAAALEALRAAGKPVYLLKGGVSEHGRRSVASHTAQFAGDDSAYSALFDRTGVVRLESMDDLVDVSRALTVYPRTDRLAVGTNSGGATAYISDACDRFGVRLADLSSETGAALGARLPAFAGLSNPVDFTPQVITDHEILADTLQTLDADPDVDGLLVFLGSMEYLHEGLIDVLVRTRPTLRNPLSVAWLGVSDEVRAKAARAGLAVSGDPMRIVRGIGMVQRGRKRQAGGIAVIEPEDAPVDVSGVQIPDTSHLDEAAATSLLAQLGTRVPAGIEISSEQDAVAAAESIGYPVFLKLVEPFIAHRARVGAIVGGIQDSTQLAEAHQRLVNSFGMSRGIVVEEIPAGPDLMVGVMSDRTFGTRAVLGAGGIWANEIGDLRTIIPPYDAPSLQRELVKLRIFPQIKAAAVDSAALAQDLSRIFRRLDALVRSGSLTEFECNPVRIVDGEAIVLDALAFQGGDSS